MGRHRSFDNNDILDRATNLFWRNGFNATSMRDLMEATGLAKASIYNAFGSKEDLFLTVLEHYTEQRQKRTLAFLNGFDNGRAALEAFFDNVLRTTIENKSTPGCLLINTAAEQGMMDEASCSIVDRGMKRTEQALAKAVARGICDGSICHSANAETAGLCLMAMLMSIRVMARKGADEVKVAKLIKVNLDCHAPKPQPATPRKASH